jgi:hypothetical protein
MRRGRDAVLRLIFGPQPQLFPEELELTVQISKSQQDLNTYAASATVTLRRTPHYCKHASKRSLDWAMAPSRGSAMI